MVLAQSALSLASWTCAEAPDAAAPSPVSRWQGRYQTWTRSATERGSWQPASFLEIGPDGRVSRGGEAIASFAFESGVLRWDPQGDDRASAAITLRESDSRAYYWREYEGVGRSFTGWLQYPDEPRLDYRGVVRPAPEDGAPEAEGEGEGRAAEAE